MKRRTFEPLGFARNRAPGTAAWALAAALMLLCLLCYNYTDIQLIARHAMNLWDVLGRGEPLTFYHTGTQISIGQSVQHTGEVPYDIWVYLPFAVWDLPVYIWEKITGLTFETNALALLWIRSCTLVPFAGALWALDGIGRDLGQGEERRGWAGFLFASSLFVFNGMFCVGQIDIFNTFFTLMGLRAYLARRHRAFVAWFALAVTFKTFGLFVFLPLVLLREKRVWAVARDVALACVLTAASKLLFLADKLQTPTGFDENRFLAGALSRALELGDTRLPLLALFVPALWVFCWLLPWQRGQDPRWAAWACLAGYASLFLSANVCPYWEVLLAPCAALLWLTGAGADGRLVALDTLCGAAFFGRSVLNLARLYGTGTIRWSVLGALVPREENTLLERAVQAVRDPLLPLAEAVCFVLLAAMTIRFLPLWAKETDGPQAACREWLWLRLAALAAFVLVPVAAYLIG